MIEVRLTGITISNVRAIREVRKFSFKSPRGNPVDTVVIAGPNGSGKTTLLESILLGLGQERLISTAGIGTLPDWRRSVPEGGNIELELYVSSAPGTILGPMTPCQIRLRRDSEQSLAATITQDPSSGLTRDTHLDSSMVISILKELRVQYFSSWRTPELTGPISLSLAENKSYTPESHRVSAIKRKIINQRATHAFPDDDNDGRAQQWLDSINKFWRFYHPDDMTYINTLKASPEPTFDLFVCRKGDFEEERLYPIDHVSSGELELFAMLGSLVIDNFDGLLLIDEPELHLHPGWQSLLLPSLRKVLPNSQIIVATHSDGIWDHVYSYERVLLLPKGDPRERSQEKPPQKDGREE